MYKLPFGRFPSVCEVSVAQWLTNYNTYSSGRGTLVTAGALGSFLAFFINKGSFLAFFF